MTDLLVPIASLGPMTDPVLGTDLLVLVDGSDLTQSVDGSTKRDTWAHVMGSPNVTGNITTVGALTSGSLTSGFGNISIGASTVTAGAASFTTLAVSGRIRSTNSSNSGSGNDYPLIESINTLATQGDGATTFNFGILQATAGNGAVSVNLAATYAAGTWEPAALLAVTTNHPLKIKTNNTTRLTLAADGSLSTFATPLAITGALTGVTTLAASGDATIGTVGFKGNTINGRPETDAFGMLYLNYYSYNGGITQFRDTIVCDGKGANVAYFEGSTKLALFSGAVTSTGNLTVGASTFVVTAATGAVSAESDITLSNAGGGVVRASAAAAYCGIYNNNSAAYVVAYGSSHATMASRVEIASPGGGVLIGAALAITGAFGCNTKAAQAAYASGGALAAYGAGANGFDSGANASALHAMVVSIRAALVANGIMS